MLDIYILNLGNPLKDTFKAVIWSDDVTISYTMLIRIDCVSQTMGKHRVCS